MHSRKAVPTVAVGLLRRVEESKCRVDSLPIARSSPSELELALNLSTAQLTIPPEDIAADKGTDSSSSPGSKLSVANKHLPTPGPSVAICTFLPAHLAVRCFGDEVCAVHHGTPVTCHP